MVMVDESHAEVESQEMELELYGDPGIASYDAKVPKFLIWTYIVLPIWGLATWYYFINGSVGWLDRGYWYQLQIAANTTLPYENQNLVGDEKLVLTEAETSSEENAQK